MSKLVVGLGRILPLFALLLALPALAAAPCISPITVQRVWTQDTGGKEKTQFAPGEAIQFAAWVSSYYSGSGQTPLAISTGFYNDTQTVNIPLKYMDLECNCPIVQGNYIVTVKLIDPF